MQRTTLSLFLLFRSELSAKAAAIPRKSSVPRLGEWNNSEGPLFRPLFFAVSWMRRSQRGIS